MIRPYRPSPIQIPYNNIESIDSSPYLLTPQSQPAPHSYPTRGDCCADNCGQVSPQSAWSQEEAFEYEPAFQYSVPPPAQYRHYLSMPPLPNVNQESLPSWKRDFDNVTEPGAKDRWCQELYDDLVAGRIPASGAIVDDPANWEACTARINGVKDATATARMLIANQDRKAEAIASHQRRKGTQPADKGPPRRQNRFICYRSMRCTQLGRTYTTFKQSHFSAITSIEWKIVDTEWWGEVANIVEASRLIKYAGQLDAKGNPLPRPGDEEEAGPSKTAKGQPKPKAPKEKAPPKPRKVSKSKASQSTPDYTRFSPYSRPSISESVPSVVEPPSTLRTPPQQISMGRTVSYAGHPQRLAVPYQQPTRRSIDLGMVSGHHPYIHPFQPPTPPSLGLYHYVPTPSPETASAFPAYGTTTQSNSLNGTPRYPYTLHSPPTSINWSNPFGSSDNGLGGGSGPISTHTAIEPYQYPTSDTTFTYPGAAAIATQHQQQHQPFPFTSAPQYSPSRHSEQSSASSTQALVTPSNNIFGDSLLAPAEITPLDPNAQPRTTDTAWGGHTRGNTRELLRRYTHHEDWEEMPTEPNWFRNRQTEM